LSSDIERILALVKSYMPCNRPARFDNHRVNVLSASKKPLLLALSLILLAGLSIGAIRPAHAAPVFVVNLDANSISQTDFTIATTAAQTHGFRVGAVLNTTAAIPLLNVQGWQFTIHYNATAFAPQGDPSAQAVPGNPGVLYVDGATNTVLFGANANLKNSAGVTENWNGLLTAGAAFRVVTSSVSGSAGALTVAYSILGTGTQVNVTAVNLLGNVAFELVNKPSTLQSFTISDVIFVDRTGALISNVIAGAGATETVSDSPPVASFTTTHLASGAPDCTPVTGAACTAYAFKFDGSASTDETPLSTAAGTAGFFWETSSRTASTPAPLSPPPLHALMPISSPSPVRVRLRFTIMGLRILPRASFRPRASSTSHSGFRMPKLTRVLPETL